MPQRQRVRVNVWAPICVSLSITTLKIMPLNFAHMQTKVVFQNHTHLVYVCNLIKNDTVLLPSLLVFMSVLNEWYWFLSFHSFTHMWIQYRSLLQTISSGNIQPLKCHFKCMRFETKLKTNFHTIYAQTKG